VRKRNALITLNQIKTKNLILEDILLEFFAILLQTNCNDYNYYKRFGTF
jgi:hypothetical protein